MPSSSSAMLKRAHRHWQTLQRDERFRYAVASATVTAILFLLFGASSQVGVVDRRDLSAEADAEADPDPDQPPRLFIAIGSAPQNAALRNAIRETWLKWLPSDDTVTYRFFTDAEPTDPDESGAVPRSVWRALRSESSSFDDIVFQPLPSGYGNKQNNQYGRRALFQARYFARELAPPATFFLRVDDDGFLCLHRLVYELRTLPRRQFFWGRFWCRAGRNRADENFMLFSADVARLLADPSMTGRLLPFDERVTLGWNFGYWSWVLNVTVFDDQRRMDAQQGYLTQYMHKRSGFDATEMAPFCDGHMYAHHVPEPAMRAAFAATKTHVMYALPARTAPSQTCKREAQSFVPGRHSSALPNIQIQRSTGAG